ncbi:thiol-disulfide oxidoreductase DCC family protein [Novosphingobium aquimarinum]|uniref:thiol-disulfide oxidoreductase DCC family protein n=1 Tax=Novosphingobium aquimarinum TaxID=2682494 RepID=UPI0012EB8CA8|nr:DUF393 domain-containing protein [Novosphingobium aquimarinum]
MSPAGKSDHVQIVYDGECPFCSAYVKMLRLRAALGPVELIDARSGHPQVEKLKARGVDLNEGMAVIVSDRIHHGAEAVRWLSLMTTPSASLNGLAAWILRGRIRSRLLYPVLRSGRNAALRLLGRRRIGSTFD